MALGQTLGRTNRIEAFEGVPANTLTIKMINYDENDIECVWGANSHKLLNHTMLRGNLREYVINHVKAPLMKILIAIAKRLPEPTKINTLSPNSHILIDVRDEFFKHENNPGRDGLFRAAFKILICEYEHDPYYRYRMDWMLEEMYRRGWQPLPEGRPRGITWNHNIEE